jgi:hypothetical protein
VDENDAPALDRELAGERQRGQVAIVVTPHGLNRGDAFESRDRLRPADITGVQDQVNAAEYLEDSFWQAVEELRTMGVRDDSDPRRQLLDPGRLQPGRVGALGVGAPLQRM